MVDAVKVNQQWTKRKSSNQVVFKFQDVSILLWLSLLLLFLCLLNQNHVSGSLTKLVVQMTGYRPSYFLCVYGLRRS